MPTGAVESPKISLRHALATLAYRAAKAINNAPVSFSAFRPGDGSRTAGQILAHMCDLMEWALGIARGQERWHDSTPQSWAEDRQRFFTKLSALDSYAASGEEMHASPDKLFQGAISDCLTHVGQLCMLRRMAGAQIRGENYYVAEIEPGRTGADQAEPVYEFE